MDNNSGPRSKTFLIYKICLIAFSGAALSFILAVVYYYLEKRSPLNLLHLTALCLLGCFAGALMAARFLNTSPFSVNASNEAAREHDKTVRSDKLAAISKLAGLISHELRNPLSAMSGAVYFLNMRLGETQDEKIKKHLKILESGIDAADKIIRGILSLGRPKEPVMAETDVREVIKKAVGTAGIPAAIEVMMRLDDHGMKIEADAGQLCSVFSNIILNAVQAMPGGGHITIESVAADGFVETRIIDTGEGIPAENLSKVFDPLFSTRPKGAGLGMAVCIGIVERHKGEIMVESEAGKGTRVSVKLPVNQRGASRE